MIDTLGKIAITVIIIFVTLFSIAMIYGIIDAINQKETLSNMSCLQLKEYLIEKATTTSGFQDVAKQLFKYKCEIK